MAPKDAGASLDAVVDRIGFGPGSRVGQASSVAAGGAGDVLHVAVRRRGRADGPLPGEDRWQGPALVARDHRDGDRRRVHYVTLAVSTAGSVLATYYVPALGAVEVCSAQRRWRVRVARRGGHRSRPQRPRHGTDRPRVRPPGNAELALPELPVPQLLIAQLRDAGGRGLVDREVRRRLHAEWIRRVQPLARRERHDEVGHILLFVAAGQSTPATAEASRCRSGRRSRTRPPRRSSRA